MSRKPNILAIFEREAPPLDHFLSETPTWPEAAKAWISLETLSGRELFNAQQVQSQVTHKVTTIWTPTVARVDSTCRMKVRKNGAAVNQQDANADEDFRIFGIESVVNVGEQNRELQLNVVEKV